MVEARHVTPLPFDSEAPAAARAFVEHQLAGWPEERVDDVMLCVSELATNALVHGAADVVLEVQVDADAVTFAVTDRSTQGPTVRPEPGLEQPRGRGLHLVTLLASAWGVRDADDGGPGKTVWCELARSGEHHRAHAGASS